MTVGEVHTSRGSSYVIHFPTREAAEKAADWLRHAEATAAAMGTPFIFTCCSQPLRLELGIDGILRWGNLAQWRHFSEILIQDAPELAARRIPTMHNCPCAHCAHARASEEPSA